MDYLVISVFSAIAGSFLNSLAAGTAFKRHSHCDHCRHRLAYRDMIPIFSYLLLKGRCRYCGNRISPAYPLSEACFILLGTFVSFHFPQESRLGLLFFSFTLLWMSLCDIYRLIVPDAGHLILISLRFLAFGGSAGDLLSGLGIAAYVLALSLLCRMIMKKDCLGLGDVKLFFALGIYLDDRHNIIALLLAAVGALFFLLVSGRKKEAIPFAPFICLAYFLLLSIKVG